MKRASASMTRHAAYAVVVYSLLAVFFPSSWSDAAPLLPATASATAPPAAMSIEALHVDIVGQKIATRLKKGTLAVKMSVTFQATGRLGGEPFDSKGKWAVKATGTPD